ncbi:SDR family NAD(P)-dependent oxidoreductase [Candidatus Villigracilis saccharophilus]|uniref:SDR family NAD(P)-dependent oxidoreductase n=1 Tax=Candidatus Villigracilis saccharophilus TaxID=3140684 RepID=UPI0031366BE8|nr:SDR family NAD(P)-dependent oxidoreductase [Anaerolineales bacterium]
MELKNKVVVVTGSSRGFGFAIAESLLEAGATVAVTGRSQQAVDNSLAVSSPKAA